MQGLGLNTHTQTHTNKTMRAEAKATRREAWCLYWQWRKTQTNWTTKKGKTTAQKGRDGKEAQKRAKRKSKSAKTGKKLLVIEFGKKVEEYLGLFETYGGNQFSLSLISSLGKLISFWGQMVPPIKLIAKKKLIFSFRWRQAEFCGINNFWVMIFWIFFYFSAFLHF